MGRSLRVSIGQASPVATVVAYSQPAGSPTSAWSVTVGGQPTWTHYTTRGGAATVSSDGVGPVAVSMTAPTTVSAVEVIAQQAGVWPSPTITGTPSGSTITFTLPAGFNGHVQVRINNADQPNWDNWCTLAVLPLETDIPDPGDVTYYFGPGTHTGSSIRLYSGQSIYVAGGAWVNRRILSGVFGSGMGQVDTIRIYGRGVVDTTDGWTTSNTGMGTCDFVGVDNLTWEGVTLVGRYGWTAATYLCRDTVIDWARIYACEILDAATYGDQGTPDGWDPVACQGFTLRRSLISASDDSSAIKASKYGQVGNCTNHLYEDVLLMQGGKSNGFDIGYELGGAPATPLQVTNITYRRVEIATCWRDTQSYRTNPVGIHLCSKAVVQDVLFEDINVHEIDTKDWMIFVSSFYTSTSTSWSVAGDANRGYMDGVTYRRVAWPSGGTTAGRITADLSDPNYEGGAKQLKNIRFEQCTIGGATISSRPATWTVTNADVTYVG
jgi:hypothetical protein